jgi:hypothetical protein
VFRTTWARLGSRPAAAAKTAFALTLAAAGLAAPSAFAATPTTYYINSCGGSDNNIGTSSNHPWASLAKVDATTFQPGDQILFRASCAWTGTLPPARPTPGPRHPHEDEPTSAPPRDPTTVMP